MNKQEKIDKINNVLADYFASGGDSKIPAKELMPLFIRNGIFEKDHKNGLPIRQLLRELDRGNKLDLIPYIYPERKNANISWFFTDVNKEKSQISPKVSVSNETKSSQMSIKARENSDEYYIIALCNEVLGLKASQQHKFDFLKGDSGRRLPVDAYYRELNLVIEYCESQHTVSTPFFDRKKTISGISRGEQRKKYDELRRTVLPLYNIKLIELHYCDFGETKRLKRNRERDLEIIRKKLVEFVTSPL